MPHNPPRPRFRPYKAPWRPFDPITGERVLEDVDLSPELDDADRFLAGVWAVRYWRWCLRTGRREQAGGAAILYRRLTRPVEEEPPSWRRHMGYG